MPLGRRAYRSSRLNKGQAAAVRHALSSWDRIMVIRGYAGTGKTTAIREAAAEIEARAGARSSRVRRLRMPLAVRSARKGSLRRRRSNIF